jgi:protocatechuate 3,4-dioxygenase beta subunit
VDGASGRGLRRARISVSSPDLGPGSSRSTSTDLSGRYEIRELPAARYRIQVTRSGYLPLDYGQRRPGEQGRPVEVADGQVTEKIDFALPRMSVIVGRISDETGEPIEGVTVLAMRSMFFEGRRKLVPVAITATDDAGEYRLQKLSPATYVVMATTKETWTITENGKEVVIGYTPTYFPGLTNGADARRVTVGLGQQVPAIDLSLVPGRSAKVAGTAFDSKGKPFSNVSLSEEIRGLNFGSFRGGYSATVGADGTFSIPNVPPGEYALTATRLSGDTSGDPEVAQMTLVVDSVDIENLMLSGSGGGTVSGKIVVESGTVPKMSAITVTVGEALRNQPSPAVLGAFRNSGGVSRVKDEGTFLVEHVFGHARFRVTVPEGFMLKAVRHEGRDLTDAALDLKSGEEVSGVEVVITDRITSLGGQLVDAVNTPVHDATVVIFSSDADKWFETTRYVKSARPDQQGQWRVKGLPPGDYLTVALDYVEDGSWNDPEYLESLRKLATSVRLDEGATQTIVLKLAARRQ